MSKLGVITEQGDFGLGFQPISEEDKNKINYYNENEETEDKKEGAK